MLRGWLQGSAASLLVAWLTLLLDVATMPVLGTWTGLERRKAEGGAQILKRYGPYVQPTHPFSRWLILPQSLRCIYNDVIEAG